MGKQGSLNDEVHAPQIVACRVPLSTIFGLLEPSPANGVSRKPASIKDFLVETMGFEPPDRRASRPPSAYSSRGPERNLTSRRAPRRGYPLRILPLPPGGVTLPLIPLKVVGSIHHITKIGAKSKSRPAPILVETMGFEPTTSAMRVRRSPN